MSSYVVCYCRERGQRVFLFVFICKQKTAYEIQYGLVGAEMCIRDGDYTDFTDYGNDPL